MKFVRNCGHGTRTREKLLVPIQDCSRIWIQHRIRVTQHIRVTVDSSSLQEIMENSTQQSQRYHLFFIPRVLPRPNLLTSLPTMQHHCWLFGWSINHWSLLPYPPGIVCLFVFFTFLTYALQSQLAPTRVTSFEEIFCRRSLCSLC